MKQKWLSRGGILVGVLCVLSTARGADWPQYRADAARGGYTAERLPAKLSLQWVRQARHVPRRAWVGRSLARSRMHFDWAYSPVVAGGTCFFGSSADDKVYAIDAATGREKWSFWTGGPVRLAPAVWKDRVYAVSDDGCLYCLRAADGKLLWKLRAGPDGQRVIGNGRMVSRWAARGGPAIRDGVVYFAAGAWPIEGVYIYAVDAKTGFILWCNDNTGALEIDQPHMVCFSRGGVASQGYLAVTEDHVLVATGRSVPAAFDRKTGDFIHFNLSRYGGKTPWGTGGGDVTATDEVFFNAGMAFDIATGLRYHDVGERKWWVSFQRDGRTPHGEFVWGPRQVICITPSGFIRSEGAAVHGATLGRRTYDANREADTARATPRLPSQGVANGAKGKHHLERIDNAPVLKDTWSVKLDGQPESMIVADKHVIAGTKGKVAMVDSAAKKVVWSAKVDGTAHALAVSDGRLIAATDTGAIYCFAAGGPGAKTIAPRPKQSPYPAGGPMAAAAEEILRRTGVTKGFCLDLDCGDGALAYELVRRTDLSVVALTADPAVAAAARAKLDAAGVYGVRAAVVVGEPKDMPDYFANLIVSSRSVGGEKIAPPADRIARIQRPFGGVLCLGPTGRMKPSVRGELAGAGSWTHNFGDAGNTMNSGDRIVKGPLGMLWYADETQETIDRHGKNPAPLAYEGVLLREGIHGLKATDAYNGSLLWEAKLPKVLWAYVEGTQIGGGQVGSTYCVADDVVYVRIESKCLLLDVFTGKRLGQFEAPTFPGGKAGRWGYIACKGGVLYGGLMNESYVVRAQHGDGSERTQKPMEDHLTETSLLFAMDARTGKLKWTFAPAKSIRNTTLAVGDGLAYLIDREPAAIDTILKSVVREKLRRGESVPEHPTGTLVALDAAAGKVKWRSDEDVFGTVLAVSTTHDTLLMSYNAVGFARPSDNNRRMRAYRASDGKRLWESPRHGTRPTIIGRTIYSQPNAWDLLTGRQKVVETARPNQPVGSPWRIDGKGQGCGLVAGCENMLLIRSGAIGYYDLSYDRGWYENYGGIRSGCFLNYIPAGGIVLVPDDTRACRCSYQNQATVALKQYGVRPPEIDPKPGQANVRFGSHAKEPTFTGSLVVTITHELPDVEIRYTLDDSYPTADSPLYEGPITLTETTPVRATAFREGGKLAVRDVMVFTKVDNLGSAGAKGPKRR